MHPSEIVLHKCDFSPSLLLSQPLKSETPVNMENLPVNNNNGQSYGYTLYETTICGSGGTLNSTNNVRDRALVRNGRQASSHKQAKHQLLCNRSQSVPGWQMCNSPFSAYFLIFFSLPGLRGQTVHWCSGLWDKRTGSPQWNGNLTVYLTFLQNYWHQTIKQMLIH